MITCPRLACSGTGHEGVPTRCGTTFALPPLPNESQVVMTGAERQPDREQYGKTPSAPMPRFLAPGTDAISVPSAGMWFISMLEQADGSRQDRPGHVARGKGIMTE